MAIIDPLSAIWALFCNLLGVAHLVLKLGVLVDRLHDAPLVLEGRWERVWMRTGEDRYVFILCRRWRACNRSQLKAALRGRWRWSSSLPEPDNSRTASSVWPHWTQVITSSSPGTSRRLPQISQKLSEPILLGTPDAVVDVDACPEDFDILGRVRVGQKEFENMPV